MEEVTDGEGRLILRLRTATELSDIALLPRSILSTSLETHSLP